MGTWPATVRFPETVRYTEYSTVVEALDGRLRPEPAADPLPAYPDRPLAPIDDLVLVVAEREPDHDRWHALYCPNRAQVIGPLSDHYRYRLRDEYDLVRDDDGVRHLCRYAGPRSECGRDLDGEPLGLCLPSWPGMAEPPDPPPAPDLFAEWNHPDLCRRCLLTWVARPGENADGGADVPESPRRRRWWRLGR